MSWRSVSPAVLLGSCLAACGRAPEPPVPLVGAAADVRALAGQWEGSYWSAATGRSGSISFTLTAQGDSAAGDVVMIPRGFGRPLQAWDRPTPPAGATPVRPAVLTINFVRVAAGRVSGSLAPYADPETGAKLFTTFEGNLRGDTIEGAYATHAAAGDTQPGQWKVIRHTR
ncbi:MAG TPA: hypothetical protein VH158_07900 [Gemmatimonadales bacterium]|nr:hypothetical protein [Gemmatimonadales bacterium]